MKPRPDFSMGTYEPLARPPVAKNYLLIVQWRWLRFGIRWPLGWRFPTLGEKILGLLVLGFTIGWFLTGWFPPWLNVLGFAVGWFLGGRFPRRS